MLKIETRHYLTGAWGGGEGKKRRSGFPGQPFRAKGKKTLSQAAIRLVEGRKGMFGSGLPAGGKWGRGKKRNLLTTSSKKEEGGKEGSFSLSSSLFGESSARKEGARQSREN